VIRLFCICGFAANAKKELRLRKSFLFAFWMLLLAGGFTRPTSAQEATPPVAGGVSDNAVNAIAKDLYCPVCENIPLDVCGTQACEQWRGLIRDKLAQGWNEDQIKQYFVDQYGDRVLGTPPARGLNWLVYVVPPLVILAGLYILYRALQAWGYAPAAPPTAETDPPSGPADPYVARLEEELRKR
jgi:cytochrome c-type biogenesis protein CcmH